VPLKSRVPALAAAAAQFVTGTGSRRCRATTPGGRSLGLCSEDTPYSLVYVADGATSSVDANSHRDWREVAAADGCFPLLVKRIHSCEHRQGFLTCILFVAGIVERRVPKRHDCIADIFVDGPVTRDDLKGVRKRFIRLVSPFELSL
jgi:hypothetical protein